MDDYREYLIGLSLSPKTVGIYCNVLSKAAAWCDAHHLDLRSLKPSQAAELAGLWPKSHSARSQLRSALRHYWDLCQVVGPSGAVKVPPKPQGRWKGLEDDQVRTLLDVARGDWPRGGVVYIGIYLGLRREEIAKLRWADFDISMTWVTIMGKGDRVRDIPVHSKLKDLLLAHRWPGEWVFPGRLGGHVTSTTVSNWISELGHAAGLGHIHPHQLRYTSGGKVNDETLDVYAAQAWLGHANVATTQIYTRVKSARLIRAMRTLDWEDEKEEAA